MVIRPTEIHKCALCQQIIGIILPGKKRKFFLSMRSTLFTKMAPHSLMGDNGSQGRRKKKKKNFDLNKSLLPLSTIHTDHTKFIHASAREGYIFLKKKKKTSIRKDVCFHESECARIMQSFCFLPSHSCRSHLIDCNQQIRCEQPHSDSDGDCAGRTIRLRC